MHLTELEEHVLAWFLAGDALNVTVDGRFYGRGDFVRIFEDRIFYATQLFGGRVAARHPNIANYLVDKLIEAQALSTTIDRLSGTSHKFDNARYRTCINDLIRSNSICQRSQGAGPDFWEQAFAAATLGGR
jgi:hypothetical protein